MLLGIKVRKLSQFVLTMQLSTRDTYTILAVTKFPDGAIIKRDGWPEFTRGGRVVRLFEVGIG